jgi:hypothetical protein
MALIKPRTRGKQLVRHRTRLDRETNETLYAYAHFIGEPTEYVLNQVRHRPRQRQGVPAVACQPPGVVCAARRGHAREHEPRRRPGALSDNYGQQRVNHAERPLMQKAVRT